MYLFRHGETEWNRDGRMQGHLDSPLTDLGASQAQAAGRKLKTLIDGPASLSFVVSPLGRTRQTAAFVADAIGFPEDKFTFDDRVREITWGELDGLTLTEIEAAHPGLLDRRDETKWEFQPPGGESYAAASYRLADWLDALGDDLDKLVVVSHGAAGRVLRGLYAKLSPDEILLLDEPQDAFFRFQNGSVERIDAGD